MVWSCLFWIGFFLCSQTTPVIQFVNEPPFLVGHRYQRVWFVGGITSNKIPLTTIVPLGHYTHSGTSHLQTVQENILSHIILATYRKFTVATVRFTQNVSCNIYTHPRYQQVANVIRQQKLLNTYGRCQSICTSHHCHIYAPVTAFVTFTPYKFDDAPRTLTWQSLYLVQCHL